ncbi:F-box protein At2g18780-like [Silene latifolia]|uniref:F-box protein At2g18780-like n=1 Tax=Silene latifolia TaxID=37657 RepID=UPI003D77FA74
MHRKHSRVNCDKNKKLLVLKRSASKGDKMSTLSILHANTLKKLSRILMISDLYGYNIVGNCNGLLLVQRYRTCSSTKLQLWNPCIRKSLILTAIPVRPNLIPRAMYLIGFAPGSKEYKVVVIVFEKCRVEKTTKIHVAVYRLSDQQWTVRNDGLDIDPSYFECLLEGYHRKYRSNAIYFQGKAHWLGNDQYGNSTKRNKSTHLISFDFDTEKFTISELPFALYETDSSSALFVLGESLAIFCISAVSSCVRVLKKGEWTLWFSGISSEYGHKVFSSYLVEYSWRNVFYCESDDGGYLICGKYSYNIATCQVQKLTKSKSFDFELDTYLESLVLLKECGVKDLMSFT